MLPGQLTEPFTHFSADLRTRRSGSFDTLIIRVFDIVIASIALAFFAPLMALIGL
jgi:lipopolysaccharide/colanic/teichoic acid biosynthesis glycosyltransferase